MRRYNDDDEGYVNKRGSDYGLYYEPETGRIHVLLDSTTIEGLAGDQSCGRYPDGTGLMQVSSIPTPLGTNAGPLAAGGN